MRFYVNYLQNGKLVGHPDHAKSILEARLLAPEGRLIFAADTSITVSVDADGNEKIIESAKP